MESSGQSSLRKFSKPESPSRLTLILTLTMSPIDLAFAQREGISTTVGIGGSCQQITLAGKDETCAGHGAMNMIFPNGHVLFVVELIPDKAISFIGEKDSQPRPGVYTLYLSRVRIMTKGSSQVINVAGQCVVHMSDDGKFWHTLDCDAADEHDAHYSLKFKSDDKPVAVSHKKG